MCCFLDKIKRCWNNVCCSEEVLDEVEDVVEVVIEKTIEEFS